MSKFRKKGGKELPANFNSFVTGYRVHVVVLLHGKYYHA